MQQVAGTERAQILAGFLAEEDRPGDQVGWQLANVEVGEAFVADDRRAAIVVTSRFAVVYGEALPVIGRFLYDRVFVGTAQGALGALDPTSITEGLTSELGAEETRVFFESRSVRRSSGTDIAPLVSRPIDEADDDLVRSSEAAWVAELWPRPSAALFSQALFDAEGAILGLGTSYAVSPRYAEIAAWIDPIAAGLQLVVPQAELMLSRVLAGGYWISSVILTKNASANRFALGAGWEPTGHQRVVTFPSPPAGSGRDWERIRRQF